MHNLDVTDDTGFVIQLCFCMSLVDICFEIVPFVTCVRLQDALSPQIDQHPQLHELVRGVDVLVAGELGGLQVVSEELCRVVGPVLHSSLSQSLLAFRGIHGHIHTVVEGSELWVANHMAARPKVLFVGDAHVLTNLAFELGEDLVLRRVLEVDGFGGDRNGSGSDEEGSLHFLL